MSTDTSRGASPPPRRPWDACAASTRLVRRGDGHRDRGHHRLPGSRPIRRSGRPPAGARRADGRTVSAPGGWARHPVRRPLGSPPRSGRGGPHEPGGGRAARHVPGRSPRPRGRDRDRRTVRPVRGRGVRARRGPRGHRDRAGLRDERGVRGAPVHEPRRGAPDRERRLVHPAGRPDHRAHGAGAARAPRRDGRPRPSPCRELCLLGHGAAAVRARRLPALRPARLPPVARRTARAVAVDRAWAASASGPSRSFASARRAHPCGATPRPPSRRCP